MSKIYALAFALSFAIPAAGQTLAASYPVKQANVVVIRTPDSLAAAFPRFTKALVAAGYGLKQIEERACFVSTDPKATSELPAVAVAVRAGLFREKDCTRIELRGTYQVNGLLGTTPVSNRGQKGSATGAAWAALQQAALLYPGGIVAYRREP